MQLSAPGVDILSTVPGADTASWSGTSMATPFVSAAAALLLSLSDGQLTASQLRDFIVASAVTSPGLADKSVTGGMLRVDVAVQLLAETMGIDVTPAKSKDF